MNTGRTALQEREEAVNSSSEGLVLHPLSPREMLFSTGLRGSYSLDYMEAFRL